ncbi:MAG: hypothetical protein M3383_08695 [Actinomycetota bacterium]|nr:hypothetical protein [Actinomycetota bacterium]
MRLRREEGFALPLALSILAIVGLLVLAAIGFATHNTDRSVRDLRAMRALSAADAGVEAAIYRMNKAIITSQVQGVLGAPPAVLAEAKCLNVSVGEVQVTEPLASGWCAATGLEEVDGAGTGGGGWVPARFSYSVSLGANIGTAPDDPTANLIERKVVAIGEVDDVSKRVLATVHLRLNPSGNLLRVFEQVGYKQCASAVPSTGDPGAGC